MPTPAPLGVDVISGDAYGFDVLGNKNGFDGVGADGGCDDVCCECPVPYGTISRACKANPGGMPPYLNTFVVTYSYRLYFSYSTRYRTSHITRAEINGVDVLAGDAVYSATIEIAVHDLDPSPPTEVMDAYVASGGSPTTENLFLWMILENDCGEKFVTYLTFPCCANKDYYSTSFSGGSVSDTYHYTSSAIYSYGFISVTSTDIVFRTTITPTWLGTILNVLDEYCNGGCKPHYPVKVGDIVAEYYRERTLIGTTYIDPIACRGTWPVTQIEKYTATITGELWMSFGGWPFDYGPFTGPVLYTTASNYTSAIYTSYIVDWPTPSSCTQNPIISASNTVAFDSVSPMTRVLGRVIPTDYSSNVIPTKCALELGKFEWQTKHNFAVFAGATGGAPYSPPSVIYRNGFQGVFI